MSAKRGLGRGFDALIPADLLDESFDPTAGQDHKVSELRSIKLSEISPDPNQPRRIFEEAAMAELTHSVREHGIVQPIIVTAGKDGYTIVAGERRYRAAVDAGLERIPALVRTLTDQHKLELSLIENLQRRDLTAIEMATAYAKLRDQFNLSAEAIGQRVGGRSASAISNTMRLLQLPKVAQQAIAEGDLTEGQARPMIGLPPEEVQKLVPKIIVGQWNARRIEQVVATLKADAKPRPQTTATKRYADESGRLSKRFAAPVDITVSRQGKGKLTIAFGSDDELQRILKELEK